MDWKRLDALRSGAGPIEEDLVEAYAKNTIGRRDFVRRGTIIGLSAPFMGAVIAACGGGSDEASTDTGASDTASDAETAGGGGVDWATDDRTGQPCPGSGAVGAVDYGHRPIPDIFLSSALSTGGVWNSSNYASAEFDSLLSDYRTAPDVEGQRTAIGAIQKLMHVDQPALYPYFFNFLAGHDNAVSGVQATALGHIVTNKADNARDGANGNMIVGNQFGDANSGLDPVAMLDLGTYNVISQTFEYLVGLGPDGNISDNALATGWSPNGDGSVWTFDLRQDAVWRDGSPLTSADVAATMDRMVEFGNSGLAGVIEAGSVDSSDPTKAVISLVEPNGNFPVLVSIFNPQSCITPADYSSGTTLDQRDEGTGAWMLDSFDASTFVARFVPNPAWWGGAPVLDTLELRGFADIGTAVTAMSSRSIDVIQNFSVIGGEGLLDDSAFNVLTPPSSNHRQLWFNVTEGEFTNNLARQALGWCLDRQQMVDTLFSGRAVIANDHPILSSLPFFDPDATPQRTRDIDKAKSLLAEAGIDEINATFSCGDLGEVPQLAAIVQQNAAEAGINLQVDVQANSTFYGDAWCPGG